MSFGGSPSDIIYVVSLVMNTYEKYQGAPREFNRIRAQLQAMLASFKQLEEVQKQVEYLDDFWDESLLSGLNMHKRNLKRATKPFKSLDKKYKTQKWTVISQFRFGHEKLEKIYQDLQNYKTDLIAFLQILTIKQNVLVIKRIDEIAADTRIGARAPTVLSVSYNGEGDDSDFWSELKRELENKGVPQSLLEKYDVTFRAYVQKLAKEGSFEEQPPKDPALAENTVDDNAERGGNVPIEKNGEHNATITSITTTVIPSPIPRAAQGFTEKDERLRKHCKVPKSANKPLLASPLAAQETSETETETESEDETSTDEETYPLHDATTIQEVDPERLEGQRTNQPPDASSIADTLTAEERLLFDGFEAHATECTECDNPISKQFLIIELCDEGSRYANFLADRVFEFEGVFYRKPRPGQIGIEILIPQGFQQTEGLITAIRQDNIILHDTTCRSCGVALFVSTDSSFVKEIPEPLCEDCSLHNSKTRLESEVEGARGERKVF